MIKSLKDLLDKLSRFTNSLVYDGGICKRLNILIKKFKLNIKDIINVVKELEKEFIILDLTFSNRHPILGLIK